MMRLRIGVAVLVVLAVLVACIPLGINYFATQWLRDQGIPSANIESVDFNLFTGSLGIYDIDFSDAQRRAEVGSVNVNVRWTSLLQGNLMLEQANLADARFEVHATDDGRFKIGGLTLPLAQQSPQADQPSEPLAVGIANLAIDDVTVHYQADIIDSQIVLNSITLDRIATWEKERASNLLVELDIDEAPLTIDATIAPFLVEPSAELDVELNRFPLASLQSLAESSGVNTVSGFVGATLKASARLMNDSAVSVTTNGSIKVDDLVVGVEQGLVENKSLSIGGEAQVTIPGAGGMDTSQFSATLDVQDEGFSLELAMMPDARLQFESLALNQLSVTGLQKVALATVELRSLSHMVSADTALVTMGLVNVGGVVLDDLSQLTIDEVSLNDVVANVERVNDGSVLGIPGGSSDAPGDDLEKADGPEKKQAGKNQTGQDQTEDSAGFKFHVASLDITGDSEIRFRDQSVTPPVSMDLLLDHLGIQDLGNVNPGKPLQLRVEIQQGDSASVTADGQMTIFDKQLSTDIALQIAEFDLSQIASYVVVDIERGKLSLDSTIKIDKDTLNVGNKVTIDKLSLRGKDKDGWKLEGMDMPLDVALGMLRDGEDRIKLEFPVTGSISDPQFNTGDIVRVALKNAMQKSAMLYAKTMLQPFGAIMFVAEIAGAAAELKFEPVVFSAGSSDLDSPGRVYLAKIAELLGSRPGLSITFCGVATPEDSKRLQEVALEGTEPPKENEPAVMPDVSADVDALAKLRRTVVFDHLVDELDIADERLFACKTKVETAGSLPPRVDISL
jgi:hypothetical protein